MEYKNYKNCLSKILKKCEKNYYSGKIKTNNIKNTWRVLNNLMKNTNENTINMNNNKSDSENLTLKIQIILINILLLLELK